MKAKVSGTVTGEIAGIIPGLTYTVSHRSGP